MHIPIEQHAYTLPEHAICRVHAKLGHTGDGSSADSRIFQNNAVINKADVFGRLRRLWTLHPQQVEDPNGELRKLAVLDEFAQVRECLFLAIPDEFDHVEYGLDDGPFEVVPALVAKDAREEGEHGRVLARELEAERSDGVNDDNLEFIADFGHKTSDLFDETVDGGLISGLQR